MNIEMKDVIKALETSEQLAKLLNEYLKHPSTDGNPNRQNLREQMKKILDTPLTN